MICHTKSCVSKYTPNLANKIWHKNFLQISILVHSSFAIINHTTWQHGFSHNLHAPWHNLNFGSSAFRDSAPHSKNLEHQPPSVRNRKSYIAFRCNLKTHCFLSAFTTATDPAANALRFLAAVGAMQIIY